MNKDELRELLHQEYKTENWKKVTEFVFPNVQYLQRPQAIPFSNDKVESFKQIGNVKLTDGKNLAMFEVKVAQNVNLARNRVELRKLVEKLIDQERNHGVLVIYEQGKEDYRFTFTAKSTEFDEEENDFVDHETDAKRFTYILGKNESCKTAANRFWELSTHKDTATIKDVENAFSVERLNKEFFNKYKEFYEDFVQYITGKRFVKEKGKWVEKKIGRARPIHKEVFDSDDKLARNFVKLLLGRLVFIQFLQKKGWMGVPTDSKQWKNGDPEFLLNLYNNAKNKDEFHSKFLYLLFYKAFNNPDRSNDVFFLTGSRVPYLNGGLFENENPKTRDIDFPATYFANLLDFFGQYNFTIDENDPQDHEVGIDPEMLGHIFENLLEDNKDKGAFYTPKPIVQYMCQESLIQYLKTYLQEHQLWPAEEEAANQTETHLQNFVRKKIAGEILNDYDEHLARALKEVKICDPAIGSGAFPMGLLNEIFYCMQVLHDASPDTIGAVWEMEEWAPDIVKKNIIQHSIYGVDIEKGAVDIARLRFWLSLIVDETEPYPLPNLDFKIMQGNSLLESYEGIDLSKLAGTISMETIGQKDLWGKDINVQRNIFDTKHIDTDKIDELLKLYFNSQNPDKKQYLKKQIDEIIHKTIDFNLRRVEEHFLKSIEIIKNKLALVQTSKSLPKGIIDKNTKAKEKLNQELIDIEKKLKHLKQKRQELHDLQNTAERPYFLWHLFFKDVFNKGGFDIVIGNPPYIGEKGNEKIFQLILNSNLGHRFYSRWMDYFYFFFHKGLDITRENGCLIFITTNYYFTSTGGNKLRLDLKERTNVLSIINFNELTIFESASGQHNAITKLYKQKQKSAFCQSSNVIKGGNADSSSLRSILQRNSRSANYYTVAQELLFEGADAQIRLQGKGELKKDSLSVNDILQKITVNTSPLGSITKITMGVVTLSDTLSQKHIKRFKAKGKKGDGIYVLSNAEVNSLHLTDEEKKKYLKPFFKNSDIKQFYAKKKNDLWLIYTKDKGVPIKLPLGIKNHFERFKPLIVGLKNNFLKNEIAASVVKKWFANGNYFVLFTPKKESYFTGPKIVAPYRTKTNDFAYTENEFYGSKDIAYILPLSNDVNLKYLTCLLNSKLIFQWLYHKGKRKGETLELYAKPLSDIPIRIAKQQQVLIELHDELVKRKSSGLDIKDCENKILCYVCKIYGLSFNEVKVIDPDLTITELQYESFTIE